MELEKLLNVFEKPAKDDVLLSRKDAINLAGDISRKIAMTAIPAALAAMLSKNAYAHTDPTIVDVLNYLLKLEYLESNFYTMAINSGIIPASDQVIFTQISNHENAHTLRLINTINSIQSGAAISSPDFDFTAGGTYPDVFTNYTTLLMLAQAFEDLGVRAYKGQTGSSQLRANPSVLTDVLSIHSVEARHAAEIRKLRSLKGWITLSDAGSLPQAIYSGEDNQIQLGIDVTSATGQSAASVTEAFDEPLSMNQVSIITDPFIV